jgi:hypothetical protein
MTGRLLTNNSALLFYLLQLRNQEQPKQTCLMELTESGTKILTETAEETWRLMNPAPDRVRFEEHLTLQKPITFHEPATTLYHAQAATTGQALCERLV